jgi:predicted nucleic acid-binding protein
MNVQDDLTFFGPELLIQEIERYSDKIILYSKLEKSKIEQLKSLIFRSINFISEDLIKDENWKSAYDLTKDIDQNDTPFVALALELSLSLIHI